MVFIAIFLFALLILTNAGERNFLKKELLPKKRRTRRTPKKRATSRKKTTSRKAPAKKTTTRKKAPAKKTTTRSRTTSSRKK